MANPDARIRQLEEALAEAEDRANRANTRARDAEESYRKLQLDLVKAKDEVVVARREVDGAKQLQKKLEQRVAALEKELADAAKAGSKNAVPVKAAVPTPAAKTAGRGGGKDADLDGQLQKMLSRVESLRELLAAASIELSQLHADEVALAAKRTRVLSNACTLLARAVGESGEAPPPIPASLPMPPSALESRLSVAPSVDISEVAELIESLRPPAPPKV
jgi:chromosome segregation ATPase